mmetsp:Transcript_4748/g.9598  ORF Transcript_4748/g.9598 Transcript_4748/m.9598 type:complete len:209 (+) Transcript_4748:906-1532(+)
MWLLSWWDLERDDPAPFFTVPRPLHHGRWCREVRRWIQSNSDSRRDEAGPVQAPAHATYGLQAIRWLRWPPSTKISDRLYRTERAVRDCGGSRGCQTSDQRARHCRYSTTVVVLIELLNRTFETKVFVQGKLWTLGSDEHGLRFWLDLIYPSDHVNAFLWSSEGWKSPVDDAVEGARSEHKWCNLVTLRHTKGTWETCQIDHRISRTP